MKPRPRLSVLIIGRGKVGSQLRSALRTASNVQTISGRSLTREGAGRASLRSALRLLERASEPRLCVIAVRDSQIEEVASALADCLNFRLPVVHTAGAMGPEVLSAIQERGSPTAQMHPLLSFVTGQPADFRGATLLVDGHPKALVAARRLAKQLGAVPRVFPGLSKPLYHAAAALLANGAAALAESATQLLEQGGVPRAAGVKMLSPLLRSVAENVLRVGLPEALSGPVRRGDLKTVSAHWQAIEHAPEGVKEVYLESVAVQITMAQTLGDAPLASIGELQQWVLSRRQEQRSGSWADHDAKRRGVSEIKVPQSRSSSRKNRAKR